MAEFHGRGIAAVLTADTDVQIGIVGTAESAGHVHQLAHTGLVQLCEGVVLKDLGIVVGIQASGWNSTLFWHQTPGRSAGIR